MSEQAPTRHGLRRPDKLIDILSRDYWFKPLDNQQINWSLIDDHAGNSYTAYFFHELSGVFDRLTFPSRAQAESALRYNGFWRLSDCPEIEQSAVPSPPFHEDTHWKGPIYSSGRFWHRPPPEFE
jgi:hypothetical protein